MSKTELKISIKEGVLYYRKINTGSNTNNGNFKFIILELIKLLKSIFL